MHKPKPKPVGRPTKYKLEHCQRLIDFFDIDPYEEREIPHYDKKTGEIVVWTDYKRMPNKLPTLRDFAKSIKVNISNVYEWLNKESSAFQSEFRDAFIQAKDIRKWFLIQNGLQGLYPPATFAYVASNITNMVNKQTQELSGTLDIHVKYVKMKGKK